LITGKLNIFSEADLDQMSAGVFRILEHTGIRVHSEEFLASLARAGANVDGSTHVVKFQAQMIEDMISERLSVLDSNDSEAEAGNGSGAYEPPLWIAITPFFHDYEHRTRRPGRREDLLDVLHWADVDISADQTVGQAITMTEVDPRVEPILAYALVLQNTSHPDPVAFTSQRGQIEFLLALSEVYFGNPVFPTGANFITSPLTFGQRMGDYLIEAMSWGRTHHSTGVMPICGGNSPMTISGNVVLSAAELIGSWLVLKSRQSEATFAGQVTNGIIDMRRGATSFNAPEALLADLGVCELFDRRFGGGVYVSAGADYIDARVPGLQAAYERTYTAMAVASFTSTYFGGQRFFMGGDGTLDAGRVFSPVQFIIDRELGAGLWRLGQGIEVSQETMALDTIEEVGLEEGQSYMGTDHTLRHYRETWFPQWLARGMWADDNVEFGREAHMLDSAHQHYRECIARYEPPDLDPVKSVELNHIVDRARCALVG